MFDGMFWPRRSACFDKSYSCARDTPSLTMRLLARPIISSSTSTLSSLFCQASVGTAAAPSAVAATFVAAAASANVVAGCAPAEARLRAARFRCWDSAARVQRPSAQCHSVQRSRGQARWMWQRAPLSVGKLRSSANARRRFAMRRQSTVANDAVGFAMAMH